jgi:uncharacterized membrane protein YccC
VNTTAALAELLRESAEWRRFFKRCCETGALRLRAQSWQFRTELRARGLMEPALGLQDLEDALLAIARKALPESPAARWDTEWADELCDDALARLAEHQSGLSAEERDLLDPEAGGEWHDRMQRAALENHPAAFRAALRSWERALLEAHEAARSKPGAA